MFYILGAVVAGTGVLWKSLGKLLHPVVRKWLSRDVSLGFVHIVSLSRTSLEQAALDQIMKALRTSLPVRVTQIYVERLTLTVGLVRGIRLQAKGVHALVEWVEDDWDYAIDDIEAEVKGRNAKKAQEIISVVQKHLHPKLPVPSCFAGFVESCICAARVNVEGLSLSLRGNGADIDVAASLHLSTSRSWAIEWRGTSAKADLQLAVKAGGKQLIEPVRLDLTAKLPKVLRTLVAHERLFPERQIPDKLAKKQVKVELSLKRLAVAATPAALRALIVAGNNFKRFSQWKSNLENECLGVAVSLAPGEQDAYAKALAKGEDVAKWEQKMTTEEIVQVYQEWQKWEVPENKTLDEWLDELRDEKKVVRSIEAAVKVDNVILEVLREDSLPGEGLNVRLCSLRGDAHLLDPARQRSSAATRPGGPAGPQKAKAEITLGHLEVTCEANEDLAMPVLEPCCFEAHCSLHGDKKMSTLHLESHFQKAGARSAAERDVIVATFSSRAVWRLQSFLDELHIQMKSLEEKDLKLKRAGTIAERRRQIHMEEVRRVFRDLDTDPSGTLDQEEVKGLVSRLYGRIMSAKEIQIASEQLFHVLDVDRSGDIGVDEFQEFFEWASGETARGMVCLRLEEFVRRLPDEFNAWATFEANADPALLANPDDARFSPEVVQLQWVRTIQNYQAAQRSWRDEIGPKLGPRFQEWRINGRRRAVDIWNDATFTLKGLQKSLADESLALVVDMKVAGMSLRLADSQHACSIPRVLIDIEDVYLQGGFHKPPGHVVPLCERVSGQLKLHAQYWNEMVMSAEPFIEPWTLALTAQGSDLSIKAEQHLVVNLTPPFLQAVSVALTSLQNLRGDHHSLQEEKFVSVWVVNHTNCDVRVSAQGPVGKGSTVSISRQDFARLVPVEIRGSGRASASRLRSSVESWALSLSGEDAVGGSWSIDQGIPFSVTGRQIFTAGSRLLAATTSVDVHSLAPIVTLSGITTVKNLTTKKVTLSDGESYTVELKSQQSWQGALGGGLALSLPVTVAGQEQHMSVALPRESVNIEGEVKELDIKHGYRFLLYQRDEPLRNAGPGQEQVVKDRTFLCVPLLNIANALPCSLTCMTGSSHSEESRSPLTVLAPGEVSGFDDIDPDRPVTLDLEFLGVRYHAVIRESMLKRKKTVMRLQAATRKRRGRNAVSLVQESLDDFCQRTGREADEYPSAPLLDVEFSWENESALLFVFARYWLANKTGWELEASTGVQRVMNGTVEQVKPSALQDSVLPEPQQRRLLTREFTEEDFSSNAPELALMRILGEKLILKIRWEPSVGDWAWDKRRAGGPLPHWMPELHDEGDETGWSQSLSVALTGTAGEVKLPSNDTVGQVTGAPSGVFGISVTDLPAPFQRTKLVTVAPRYIVRNDLDEAVQIWPSLGTNRRVPTDPAPDGLPTLQPGMCLSIDAFPPSSRILALPKELVSVRACSSGETGRWSSQVHLSMVGETTFSVGTGARGDPQRVVRASVQRIGPTVFLVLVKGRWPYSVENHSLTHTVAFHQLGAEDEEWVLNPCETQNFVFPNPDKPKHIAARICGAGQELSVHYALNDLSASDLLPSLKVFGERRKAALHAAMHFRAGHTKVLTLHDEVEAEEVVPKTAHSRELAQIDTEGHGGIMKLDVDIFLMGVHVSLIDTRPASPVEMIGLTVDYIQLQKHRMQRSVTFTVHSCQIDDFGQEESLFVFGPAMSGLNSQRSAMADSKNFKAQPFFQVSVSAPRNPQNPIFDVEHGMLTLNAVEMTLQPMEANVDVPRLLSIAMQLKRWLGVIDTGAPASREKAAKSMERSLAPGFRTPKCGGDIVCYVAKLWAEAVSIVVDVKLSKRQSDQGDEEDVQSQLRRISANLWLPLRSFLEFFARMGTSFAEASPHFSFRRLDLNHLTGSVNMVTSSIASEYQSQVVAQVAKSLGSLQVLGDPVNLLDDISSGFNTFLLKTREELQGEREGLGEGVTDLAGGVVGGALGSISKVTGALKDMVGSVTGRPLGSNKRAVDISDGIDLGLMSLASGVSEAVTGLVEDPMEQAEIDGFLGFCRGTLQGGAGFMTRPVEGFLGAMEKFAQGAEHQVRGVNRGYGGLRRPPRVQFAEQTRGLQALHQMFFWPQWVMTVRDVKLPALWKERRVKQLVIFPGQATRSLDTEICIVRGSEVDSWALEGRPPQNEAAIGRTGSLRGPFLLQVDANVEGNLEMTNLFRVTVGTAKLPVQDLARCLSESTSPVLTFSIIAQRSPALGEHFTVDQDEVLGEVTVELTRFVNSKILPQRFVSEAKEGSENDGPQEPEVVVAS